MTLLLRVTFLAPFLLPPVGVYLELDPLLVVLIEYFDKKNMLLFLIRTALYVMIATDVMKAVNAFFIVGLMVICSMNDIMQDLNEACFTARVETRMRKIVLYKQMFIWNKYTNQHFCSFSVPPLIFFGIGVIVLTYFGSIRMFGTMDFLIYIRLPVMGVLGTFFVVMLIPHAAKVVEFSTNFIIGARNEVNLSKFERKTWQSVRPLGIQVGDFGHVNKKLKPLALKYIAENTVTLLLTF